MTHRFYENQYGCIYFDRIQNTPIGRVNFLNIVTPGQKFGKYSGTLYCDKNSTTEQAAAFQDIIDAAAELTLAKFGAADAALKNPAFRDGDEGKVAKVEAAHGNWVIVGNNGRNRPDVFDSEGNDFDPKNLQSGMQCRFVVKMGINDDGIFYQLEGIQVVADDGVRFRVGPSPRGIAGTVPGGLVVGGGEQAVAQPAAQPAPAAQPVAAQPVAQAVQPVAQPAAAPAAAPAQPAGNLAAAMAQPAPAPAAPTQDSTNDIQNALDAI